MKRDFVTPEEQACLVQMFALVEPHLPQAPASRRYIHLYMNGDCSDVLGQRAQEFTGIAEGILRRYNDSDVLGAFGYMLSESGAPAQDWHIDYEHADLGVLYVPLTEETKRSSTQFQKDDGEPLQYEGPPFRVLVTPKRAVHRGVLNEGPRRVLWYCIYGQPSHVQRLIGYEPVWRLDARLATYPDESAQRFRQ